MFSQFRILMLLGKSGAQLAETMVRAMPEATIEISCSLADAANRIANPTGHKYDAIICGLVERESHDKVNVGSEISQTLKDSDYQFRVLSDRDGLDSRSILGHNGPPRTLLTMVYSIGSTEEIATLIRSYLTSEHISFSLDVCLRGKDHCGLTEKFETVDLDSLMRDIPKFWPYLTAPTQAYVADYFFVDDQQSPMVVTRLRH